MSGRAWAALRAGAAARLGGCPAQKAAASHAERGAALPHLQVSGGGCKRGLVATFVAAILLRKEVWAGLCAGRVIACSGNDNDCDREVWARLRVGRRKEVWAGFCVGQVIACSGNDNDCV